MFWMLEQRRKEIEKARQEAREALLRELEAHGVVIPSEVFRDIIERGTPPP